MEILGVIDVKMSKKISRSAGFTLIEILITLAISGVLMIAVYAMFQTQQDNYLAQDAVAEMQQNIRVAVDLMAKDLRMAGYDPQKTGNMGFVSATNFDNGAGLTEPVNTNATSISFLTDLDGDGNIDRVAEDVNGDGNKDMSEIEQVSYRLNGTDLQRYSTTSGAVEWQVIAENIQALEFQYLDSAGVVTANFPDIRSVQISILARAEKPDRKFVNSRTYTPASGVVWDLNGAAAGTGNPPNDSFRRRLEVVTVKCRNMGL